ncbi:uncharacterized protein LOC115677539 [Syzygium oleosum]|uniref:uncharacterized protein LOC115677539 n=1 Tax=Syzygium oleosum TaxID=219896 RepID=UPI0024B92DE0|nr:uncharacterized protein LOC115677539 [Syzygium oleosum]
MNLVPRQSLKSARPHPSFALSLCYSSEPPPLRQTPLRRSLLPPASHDGHPQRHRRCLLLRRHLPVPRPHALPRAPPGSGAPSPRAPRSPSRTEFVSPSHLELWSSSQHRVRLGKYKRDADSLRREGENSQAVWRPDTKLIAVVTTSLYLHLFKVHFSEKRVQIGGKQPSSLYFATISLLLSEQVPFGDMNLSMSNIVSGNRHMLLGLFDGSLYGISWKGEVCFIFFTGYLLSGSEFSVRRWCFDLFSLKRVVFVDYDLISLFTS